MHWRLPGIAAALVAFGAVAALAQLSTTDQQVIAAYEAAMTAAETTNAPRGIESAFSALAEVRNALMLVRGGRVTILESLPDAEFMRVTREVRGARISRDDVVFIEPDPDYFSRLAAARGTDADRAFFRAFKATYPASVFPAYVEQQTDYSGCTRFGSQSLVDTYQAWSEFERTYPDRYAARAKTEADRVLGELTTSTCACGEVDGAMRELETFVKRFPSSPATVKIGARLAALKGHRSDIRAHCVSG